MQVNRFLKQLQKHEQIECVDRSSSKQTGKAMRWLAHKELLELHLEYYAASQNDGVSRRDAAIEYLKNNKPLVEGRSFRHFKDWVNLLYGELGMIEEDVVAAAIENSTADAKRADYRQRFKSLKKGWDSHKVKPTSKSPKSA